MNAGFAMPAVEAVRIAGEEALCDVSGALFFPAFGLLAVSDLHLEKGAALARRGHLVPPYDTAATLARLGDALSLYRPRTVISLGDSFHDGRGAGLMPETFRRQLAGLMAGRDWLWVTGNHDPDAPEGVGGDSVGEVALGSLLFRHEPGRGAAEGEVAGHLHPGARLVRRGRSVRRRCFASDGRRLVMPAFGAYTGMLNVLDRAYAGLFDAAGFHAYMIGARRIYRIAHDALSRG